MTFEGKAVQGPAAIIHHLTVRMQACRNRVLHTDRVDRYELEPCSHLYVHPL